jgi:hypothetical protein
VETSFSKRGVRIRGNFKGRLWKTAVGDREYGDAVPKCKRLHKPVDKKSIRKIRGMDRAERSV